MLIVLAYAATSTALLVQNSSLQVLRGHLPEPEALLSSAGALTGYGFI